MTTCPIYHMRWIISDIEYAFIDQKYPNQPIQQNSVSKYVDNCLRWFENKASSQYQDGLFGYEIFYHKDKTF